MYISEERYLAHYGVKGMKWGVRRYENDSRVQRGKRLYSEAKRNKSASDKRYAKREIADARTRVSMENRVTNVSDREKKFIAEYQKSGLTKSEAELAAYKRQRTEKALMLLGGVGVGVAAAYLAKRGYVRNFDSIIKAGTKIQNLNTHNPKAVADGFYGAFKRGDMIKYKGQLAKQLQSNTGSAITKTMLETTSDMKIASSKSAQKVMQNLIKTNPAYKEALMLDLGGARWNAVTPKQKILKKKAFKSLAKGKIDNSVYEAQNIVAGDRGSRTSAMFKKALKDAGYDGVRDVNDLFYSGYNAKSSTIFVNAAKTKVTSASQMSTKEINARFGVEVGKSFTKSIGKTAAVGGGVTSAYKSTSNRKAVEKYRQEHPNTSMSYNEILRSIEESKKKK